MNESQSSPTDDLPDISADVPKESARTILFQFVVFPLAVVVTGVAIFFLFGLLASEEHTIPEYVQTIRSGSSQRRWQAAYQLSKSIKRGEAAKYPQLQEQIAELYRDAADDDPRLRPYLSMVLGTLGDRRSTPVLIEGLADKESETRLYALWALGEIGDPRALPAISRLMTDPDPAVRKTAVFALGKLQTPAAVPVLISSLDDPSVDVRWNAALALARHGDRRALPHLRSMLRREHLNEVAGMSEEQKEQVLLSAITAATAIDRDAVAGELRALAESDPSLRVRSAAKTALR